MSACWSLFAGVIFFCSLLNASLIGLAERRREVATLRVLGYSAWQVGGYFLRESLLVNSFGTLLGLPLGYSLAMLISIVYNTEMFRFPLVSPPAVWVRDDGAGPRVRPAGPCRRAAKHPSTGLAGSFEDEGVTGTSPEVNAMRSVWMAFILLVVAVLSGIAVSSFSSAVLVEAARVTRGSTGEYIDEEAKTRLAQTYLITMPFNGRIEAIELSEGSAVRKGQVVARIVPLDTELTVAAAKAAVDRLQASIKENDDVTVETTTLEQALNFVDSMNRTVEAAAARVKSGEAKLEYAEKILARAQRMFTAKSMAENELDQARVSQVESEVQHEQDMLVLRAVESLRAATALMPTAVRQYIQRKTLSRDVLEKQLAEAQVNLQQSERDRQRGNMTSPVDGVVLERVDSNERQFTRRHRAAASRSLGRPRNRGRRPQPGGGADQVGHAGGSFGARDRRKAGHGPGHAYLPGRLYQNQFTRRRTATGQGHHAFRRRGVGAFAQRSVGWAWTIGCGCEFSRPKAAEP